jgi:spore germination protein YaaH
MKGIITKIDSNGITTIKGDNGQLYIHDRSHFTF